MTLGAVLPMAIKTVRDKEFDRQDLEVVNDVLTEQACLYQDVEILLVKVEGLLKH
jgi:hypothetical protein